MCFSSVISLNFVLLRKLLLNFYITKLKEIKIKTLLYVDRLFFLKKIVMFPQKVFGKRSGQFVFLEIRLVFK
jgi:hypothetical protein